MQNKNYIFVDFRSPNAAKGGWVRTDNYSELLEEAAFIDCFASVQKYENSTQITGEPFVAPLYFDFDSEHDVELARQEAVKLVEFFVSEVGIATNCVRIFFSGSKGFHLIIHEDVFNIKPSKDLHKVYKHIAGYLRHRLSENEKGLTALDMSVYTVKRMLRLNNTKHSKTGLYKIEIDFEELSKCTVAELKEKAVTPRQPIYDDRAIKHGRKLNKEAEKFFNRLKEDYDEISQFATDTPNDVEFCFVKNEFPVCIQNILDYGWKIDGGRNQATIQLGAFFYNASYSVEETLAILIPWVKKHSSAKSPYDIQKRVANTRNVINSVYELKTYKFGCAFIRSLHADKTGDDNYDRVPCSGKLCPYVKRGIISTESSIALPLADTGLSQYSGKLVSTRVLVAGKKSTPYIIPAKVEYSCVSRCDKQACPLNNVARKIAYKDLETKDRELIQMCGVGDDNIKGILRGLSGIIGCNKYDVKIIESINMEELLVIPMVEFEETAAQDINSSYVLRKVYSAGNLGIIENKYYELTGYVFPHPKNQEGTILIQAVKPLQDVIETFHVTPEITESLKVFTPKSLTPTAIYEKLGELLNTLTYNITGIVERDEVLLGALLVFHSILRLNVPWDIKPIRGWLETIIVGDTGTGKSAMVEKLMTFIGLGSRVNAESTTRTGLTYKMEQSNSGAWYIVWGAWPLADKELIWIDEAAGIPKEEYGQMTLARSEGRLEVKRAVTAETTCRVRAILTSNAINGKRLSDYVQGCESLKYVFNNEDIRRFDFALFMKAGDVEPHKYNTSLGTYTAKFTKEQLKNNVLFAWSRTPDQVKFTQNALDKILQCSTELSKSYGSATDVPLVSPSDQRNKLARLSAALASLLHYVDADNNIIVAEEMVDFIFMYLKKIYNMPSSGLNNYSKLFIKEDAVDDKMAEKIKAHLVQCAPSLKKDENYANFIRVFAEQKYARASDVETMLGTDKEETKALIGGCIKARMLLATTNGFKKTTRFNSYIEKCFADGIVTDEEDIFA